MEDCRAKNIKLGDWVGKMWCILVLLYFRESGNLMDLSLRNFVYVIISGLPAKTSDVEDWFNYT